MNILASRLKPLLLAATLCCLPGCFVSQNPSYFPYWLPTGKQVETHAKPIWPGYNANFDPHAIRLEVRPKDEPGNTNPVRTQYVLIATVYDEKGQPRRNRRVEWILEGVGNIIEVDESGILPGRGYKSGTKHAVSYTNVSKHTITRGNTNANDDFMIHPGQTWCVISSAVEGDTHVTAYAPGIANWEKGRVFVTAHWVDAGWEFPQPAQARSGSEHVFNTKIFRHTDKQPLANYRVRYKVLDGGPPAVLLPSRTQEYVAISDLSGNAQVAIAQTSPSFGINRVGIEIIRPPDPTSPSGAGLVIARGETSIEWLAPAIGLSHTGPAAAGVGQEVTYTSTISNTGRLESKSMSLTSAVPDGLQYVRSQPPAFQDGRNLVWTLGALQAGQSHTVTATFKTLRLGPVTECAAVQTEEGLKDEKCVTTQVAAAALKAGVTGPQTGFVNAPLTFNITAGNPGGAPVDNVLLIAQFDDGLEHESKSKTLNLPLGVIQPQDTRSVPLTLTPRRPGQFRIQITATSGTLTDQASHTVVVQEPQVSLSIDGPKTRYVGRPADWTIRIANPGDVPLTNVQVRERLPAELTFVSAPGGVFLSGEVVWNLGNLQPKEQKVLQLTTNCQTMSKEVLKTVQASADLGIRKDAQATLEILGVPALTSKMVDAGDPVEVGKKITYNIEITNQGSLPADDVEVRCILPPELKLTSARGPAPEAVAGQVVTFGKINGVQAGKSLSYTIEAEALKAGDIRFRMELRGQSLTQPVIEEESTRIYNPGAAPPGNAPVPPPPPPPPPLLEP